ncbi:extracellular solute-binding protein [Bifidobacterium pseudolongum]|uniref:extracellular solute-binding protein n=1 Tax=Bifidobacterium pseudolongum TaxID=1694 RepID=UPI000C7140DC|nr:extracellular solute-binding protein [Bifidobacterium pseudolongum]PKU99370.1 ABC transporter substrate-binding protein [Bifidobacterium pseudolongum subsp. globosum]RYQ23783.1 ABC transporter substrate-binding protein [Bifidobacterium pseudolongum subsp. globosum]RYQ54803.1 ABC transporter substrate-binding protein [Bifidobacterium pseudolongum subsp. globosum]RYQ70570.1 ABC transporter substrate-binding protein [Bifidobacterium pseudolongum subsp. globosum]RYQ77509.1 ABC transporter subst
MKHTPWKTAVAAVAGTSLLLGLGACGRSEDKAAGASEGAVTSIDSEPATGDLTVWAMGNEGDLLGDFVEGFKEENPDVNITVTAIPWASAHDKIQTAIAAGTVPDVIQMGTTWMADFADAFAPVPENFDLSDFSAGPLEAGQVNGEQLGVPWYVDSHVLYYRTDIAEQAGWDHAPETLDELKQMAADVKQVDGVENGIYISPSGADSWQGTLWAFFSSGVSLMDDEGNWTLDTPQMHEATEYIDSFFKDGITGTNLDVTPGVSITQFVNGETPIMTGGPTTISQIADQGGDPDSYATAVIPKGESSTSFVGGADFVVMDEAANPDAGWKFIQWMTKPETQVEWYKTATVLPSSQSAWEDETFAGDDKLMAYGEQLKSTQAPPAVPTWAQVSAAGDRIMEQIYKGQLSVDEGLKNLQAEAESIGTGE